MTRAWRAAIGVAVALAAGAPAARAQEDGVRAALQAHGVAAEVVEAVAAAADRARAGGLPSGPLVDKALEGWAKGVPGPRIVGAVDQYVGRMAEARALAREAGIADPPGEVIAAVAEARLREMAPEQVREVLRAGRSGARVATGLKVATALAAQGLGAPEAVRVVTRAMRQGRGVDQLLDLPAQMRALEADGLGMGEITRRMLGGGAGGAGGWRGAGGAGASPGGASPPPPPPGGTRSPGSGQPGGSGRGPG